MPNPQQPELRRSGHHALDPDAPTTKLPAADDPAVGGNTGPVPDENLPGHHPEEDQDKPDGDDFVAKAREVAARAKESAASSEDAEGPSASGAPSSTAPVSAAPATADAVVADAMDHTPAGEGAAGAAAPSDTAPSDTATPTTTPASGGTNPLVAIATFQWKAATLPVRVAMDVVGRIRRRL